MVEPSQNKRVKATRYLSVLLTIGLAAAGTIWLRGRLVNANLDEKAGESENAPAKRANAKSDAPPVDIEKRPRPKLTWKTVDGGAALAHSDDAQKRWEANRKRIYDGLREQKHFMQQLDAGDGTKILGTLKKEYIQQAIDELKPMFKECYELSLSEDERTGGKLTVTFSIAGDSEGGIVESAEIADGATADNDVLRECMRETIYLLELPAPEGGGVVSVPLPFYVHVAALEVGRRHMNVAPLFFHGGELFC